MNVVPVLAAVALACGPPQSLGSVLVIVIAVTGALAVHNWRNP